MIAHMHKIHRLRQMLTRAQTLNYTNSKHPNTVSQQWFNYLYKLQGYIYNTALSSELKYINDDQLTDDNQRKKNIKDKLVVPFVLLQSIYSVSWGIVNILRGDSMDYSE